MHNLALPEQRFFHHTKSWAPQNQSQPLLHLPVLAGDYEAKFVPILWLQKNMKVVACVEWDFDNLDEKVEFIYLKWLRVRPVDWCVAYNKFKLVETLRFIHSENKRCWVT
jgi:hypothetical protein